MSDDTQGKRDRGGLMLAIGVYVLSAVFGWAAIGVLLVLWWGR
jgi:hypothetical protein